ncbi:hypothetical protein B7494_g4218 [Chlorociboria aeruginascens]|nr:hypothetical protein B7494_g4218 [Chlorociboria aeruginascens]
MADKFVTDFTELVGVRAAGDGQYKSISRPERMGNAANIAYGGCSVAVALSAAHDSVSPKYRLYSAMGNYLAPALNDRNFSASVRVVRDTTTFATRQVELSQKLDSGHARVVMLVCADFQVPEEATVLEYSLPPSLPNHSPGDLLTTEQNHQKLADQNLVHPSITKMHSIVFGLMGRHFETRPNPDGVFAQNVYGMAKNVKTTQDDRPLTSKVSGDWVRTHQTLKTHAENIVALSFLMDGALSFLPLSHSHRFFDDVGACSSLDFAFRLFSNDVNLRDWHRWECFEDGDLELWWEARKSGNSVGEVLKILTIAVACVFEEGTSSWRVIQGLDQGLKRFPPITYNIYFCSLSPSTASEPKMVDRTPTSLSIRSRNGETGTIPLLPPMTSFAEARNRIVEMDATARSALDISDIRITKYEPPSSATHLIVFGVCLWTYAMLGVSGCVRPGTFFYDDVLKYLPEGRETFDEAEEVRGAKGEWAVVEVDG